MKHVYFIRHGQSTLNIGNLAAGTTDAPLTPVGIKQADDAGKQARMQGLKFDVVISSPLQRAHNTARAVALHVDYPLEDIVIHDGLVERNFGELEGRHITADYGISGETYMSDPFAIDHIPGVEKITDLQYRANKFLEHVMSRPETTILIVGHGAFARSLQRAIANAPLSEPVKRLNNAEVIKII